MINLLPPEQKKELLEEERLRIILILGTVIIAFLICLTLILLALRISFSADFQLEESYFKEKERELEVINIQELEQKIKDYNLSLSKLENFYKNQFHLTEILEKIFVTVPDNSYLTSIGFDAQTLTISLNGFSPDRQTLLQFKENLEKSNLFKEVDFPQNNWLESVNINFSAALIVDNKSH